MLATESASGVDDRSGRGVHESGRIGRPGDPGNRAVPGWPNQSGPGGSGPGGGVSSRGGPLQRSERGGIDGRGAGR
ncbi:MAG TPA: hypothetical protein VEX15_09805 [Nocardioidaceae bacterium]|nr:hypothetical protein [Nocardioidaceae bacterium]